MKLSEVLQQLDEKSSMAQLYKLYNQAMKAVPGSKKHKELEKQISKIRRELKLDEKTKGSLGKWFREKWVDISRTNKDGSHPPCGASAGKKSRKGGQRAYPKCRKKSVADRMTKKEKKNAVARKRKHYGSKGRPKKKAILQK
tara:strand:+ start:522 stop:947 length:426 start_codon:yes stop_codon:yes gene_type:complete